MRNTTISFSAAFKKCIMLVMIAVTAIFQLQAQTYSFTTCGATGPTGPTQTQVNLAYASSSITGVVSNNGIQEWTVPATGLYSFKVAGAKGGGAGGGNGAVLSGEFMLTQGQVIQIAVGQRGTGGFGQLGSVNSGGGGGGSFVVNKTTNTILLIAGGGGGGNGDYGPPYTNTAGNPANTGTSGNSTYQGGGGTNGNGGKNGVTNDPAAGGGGYFSNGENSTGTTFATGGAAFVNGANGGSGRTGTYFGGNGGFGGGGGGVSNVLVRGGGGGGYSGGQGGSYSIAQPSVYTSSFEAGHGAGGGSINNGTNPLTYVTNAAAGYVTVTTLSTPAGALNFVKSNNTYITVPHSASMNLGAEFTIEAWVNYTGVNSTIIDKGDYDYLLQVNCNNPGFAPNRLNFYNRNTGWVHSIGTVPEGTWTHIAVTLKNGTMTFYINGVASGTAPVNYAQDNGPVNIGRQSPSSCACNIFNGNMDELRVWNRALSACEISSNKNCELNGVQTGLAAYYKFNQGAVNMNNSAINTLTDASGNNNTGSLTGFALNGSTSNWVAGQVSGTCGPIVTSTPTISASGSTTFCAGGSVTLTASAGSSYLWSNGATTPSITVSTAGAYTVTVTNANGCSATSAPTNVTITTINNQPVSTSVANLCGTGSSTVTLASSQTGVYYTLRNNADNAIIAGPVAGTGAAITFNTGTISATTTYNVLAETKPTGAFDFNGTTYVTIPHNNSLNVSAGGQLTMEAWVNPAVSNQWRNILMKGAYGYGMAIDELNRLYFWDQGGGNAYDTWSNVTVPTNTWSHVAVTVQDNGSSLSVNLYLNGVNVGNKTSPIAQINDNTESLIIGRQGTGCGCNYFNGKLDDVRIWNTVRSASAIAASMNSCLAGSEAGLVALYKMDDGSGTTVLDSKSANNGTVVGTASWTTGNVVCGAVCSQQMTETPTITVKPLPTVNPVTNIEVCHNSGAVPAINFTGSEEGATYSWTNDNPSIGLAASGTGSIASFTALNPGTAPVYANITVTPSYTVDGNTCTGTPVSFVIRVNPIPVFNAITNQSLCVGSSSTAINLTSAVAGTTFTWFNTTPAVNVGLANGSGATIPSFTAVNNTSQPITATYLALSYYQGATMGCGTSRQFTYTVNPIPQAVITASGPTAICNNGSVTLTASAGVSYLWSNGATSASITVSQAGNYSVTVTGAGGCTATSAPVSVTTYALPTISCPSNISVVSAANQCGANVTYPNAVVTSGPANPTITYSHPSGSFFPVGNTTVTATITDACGNTASCTFVVTVQDITPPVLACSNQTSSTPVNFMRGTSVGGTAAIVSWTGINGASQYASPSLGSSCSESWRPFGTLCDETPNTNSMTTSTKSNPNSGITFNTGGVNSTGVFVVDLGATQTFNLAQVYQMFSDGKTTHVRGFYHPSASATAPSITDAGWVEMFPETLVGPGAISGSNVTLPTEITFSATSARYVRFYVRNDGRYGSGTWIETRSIKLFSTAPAVNNVVVTAADGQCNAVATYNVQAIDNCPGTVVTYSIPSGSSFPIGTTPVQVTATDASGNTTTCSFSVIVNAPEINVTGNSNNITSGTTTTSAANNTNLGGTLPNTPVSKNFVIQNTGTAALNVSAISLSGIDAAAFSINGITLPATVAPNASANFNVVFNSNTPGIKEATVTIHNGDCNETVYQFAVSGEVTCTHPVFINQNLQVQANTTAATCNAVVNYPLAVNGIPAPGLSYTFSGATTGSGSGTGSGQTFNKGTTHVIVTATNACSTVINEFDVIVTDNVNPIAIAQNITVNLNAGGTATITASQINNGSTDNCAVVSINIDKTNFDCSNTGANTVTLTVTDASGNSATATATVTVVDNILPTITAPAGITVNTTVNCTATGVVLGTPVTADNCAVQSVTNNAPAVFPIGNTTVTWTVTDASGNTANALQTVTVKDVIAPAPNVVTLPTITGECSVIVTSIPQATDNCSGTITATTTNPLSYNNQGTYTITWKYTDAAGNSSTQTQTVIVKDITPPVVSCPPPITTTAPSNQCGATVTFPQPTVTDNCSSGTTGVHTLTRGAQFFDHANNVNEAQFSPGLPMSFFPTDGQKLAVFLVSCGSTHYMYQNITLPASGPINLGMDMKYTNHYASGFSANQFIAVELRNPTTNALLATLFKTNPGAPQSTPMTHYNFDLSAYAGQQVRLQMIDATINNYYLDVELDNITIPGSTLVNGSFETGNYSGWTIGSASSTCGTFGIGSGPSVTIAQTAGLPSGSIFPIGTTTNTFEVTDLAGNKTTCSFNVTVNAPEINISGNGTTIVSGDNTPSTTDHTDLGGTIPGNSISKTFVIANNGTSALTVSSINISNAAFTRSGISLPATIQPGQTASFTVSFASTVLGVQTAVVTVNNNDCNEAAYSFTVKAEVTCTNPVFVNFNAQVPANTTATTCNAVVNYPLAITGIPAPGLSYTFSGATTGSGSGTGSGQTFNKGTTHVVVTAVNPCNTVLAEFDVIVADVTPPIAIAQNLTVYLDASGAASITAAQINNGSSDNCGIASISVSKTGFDCSNVGVNNVILTVTDVNGNVSTAAATVTVVDAIAPSITAPAAINQGTDAGVCGATVNLGTPVTADNCSIASVTNNAPTLFPVGTTIVTWTVTDANGNSSTATQTVVISDTEKPKITAPALVSVVNIPGSCMASVDLGTAITSDNCGVASVTNNAPALFPVGTTIVRWTVTDIHGNVTDTATQEVVVIDNENPTISVSNISVNNDAGKCGATVVISLPQTADNCGVATVMGVRSDNKLLTEEYPVGTTTITWTVRDVNGNIKTATQTIVVTDNEKPVIACAANQVFCANTGGNTQYSIPVLNQSDNCGIAGTTYSITGATNRTGTGTNASGSFAIGTSTVTFTVTDIHGNVSTCSFTVTINPLPVASISAASPDALCNQFTLTANSTLSGPFTYQWLYNNNTRATTQQLSLGLTDADGVYSVYSTDVNGCRSELAATYNYQKQNLVSSYTILGMKEVKLGQYNKVETGSVGVMSSRGEAEFDKYSSVTGAGSFVKAPKIDADKGVTINSKIFGVASVTLPTMQYNTSNTRYLQDKTINANVTTTVTGNYDEVTLKKGSNVTLTGTVFGKIKLEEGASVRFTSTTIDVEEIQIEKGPKSGGYSYIRFAPNTSIRVSKKVTIGSDVIVNPEAYQVTFYMADNRRDEEKFHVKGDDTRITANIILPDGKLKVTGGNYGDDRCDHKPHSSNSCRHKGHGHHDCDHRGHGDRDCRDDVFMTGLFIAEEVESEGKNIIWNSYNCAAPSAPVTALTSNNNKASVTEEVAASGKLQAASKTEEELKVTVMPNPTRTYFTLKLESKYDAPVTLRVVDAAGRVVDSRAKVGSNSTIQIGHNYHAGNYFAEFIQGNRRKTIQLIKVQ